MRALAFAASAAALMLASLPSWDARADAPVGDLQPIFVAEIDGKVHSVTDVEGEDGFAVNRLRLGGRMTIARWFGAVAQIEFIDREHPTVLDAAVALRPIPSLEILVGASPTPLFSSARDEPIWTLPLPELSMVTRAFWPAYDVGIEVHELPTPRLPLEGFLRVGNGSGSALGNDNNDYAFDARLDVALARAQPQTAATALWGLRFGAGLHAESAEDRLGIGGTTPDGYAFYKPATVSGPRSVVEAHFVGYLGPVKLTVEVAQAKEGRAKDTDGDKSTPPVPLASVTSRGAVVEAGWMVFGPWRRHGARPVASPIGTWDWGALEIGARAERLELGRGAPDVDKSGAWSASGAMRWWTTSFLATSVAAYWTRYDVGPVEQPDNRTSWFGLARVTVSAPADLLQSKR